MTPVRHNEDGQSPPLRLAACVLLAGSLTPSPLTSLTGGSVLDLFLNPRETVLDIWIRQFEAVAVAFGQTPKVHVIYGMASPIPAQISMNTSLTVELQEDAQQFRGPGGAVRDICQEYPPDATLIVAEAARYLCGDLLAMVEEHGQRGADITVVCNEDSTPAGLFLIRRSTLDLIPKVGFTDLKEQWLKKAVDEGLDVRVHRLRQSYSYELRTREGFINAARAAGGVSDSTPGALDGVAGDSLDGNGSNQQQEREAIGPSTVIVDSVVMPGATVGAGAVVARSIVCPGAEVAPRGTLVDGVAATVRRGQL